MSNKSLNLAEKIAATYQGKTILISGACGFIGSGLARALLEVDCRLRLLDHSANFAWVPEQPRAEVGIIQADVSRRQTWEAALPEVDFLFHLAAMEYNRAEFNVMEDWQTNALAVIHLLEVCRKNHLSPRIIFSSSANLFGLVDSWPVNEKQPSQPITPWSIHKLLAENYLNVYALKYGINSTILRLANVYGTTENKIAMNNVVINNMISRALNGETLKLYRNRNCIRDFIFLKDVVMAFLQAGVNDSLLSDKKYFVIGSGEGKTFTEIWRLIAAKVRENTGKKVSIVNDDAVELEPFDMRNFIADFALFQKLTGWQPSVFMEEGLTLTLNELLSLREKHCCPAR